MTDQKNDDPFGETQQRETRTARTDDDSQFSQGTGRYPVGETVGESKLSADEPIADSEAEIPKTIGRYRVERVLGRGGFGRVYLAHDDELQRNVTIKVPHAHRIRRQKDIDAFLAEARTLAKLEHPNVVPVHDVGNTEEGTCFMVSRYIDGSDLMSRIRSAPLTIGDSVELVATIAEALHYVHSQGVIHRDIKPNNILLDKRGTAYLADFGLALLENDAARTSSVAGTPAYMSPEQARGENHLVSGTSDIFSLGVVLYQMLTGQRPFVGDNAQAVLRMIQEQEVRPLRDLNHEIPAEIERICMKALSKRASARHSTALDFCDDLRHFLSNSDRLDVISGIVSPADLGSETERSRSGRKALGIVPRGLRSFGPQDSHFFLGLLPGPYDRDGTPESVLFWKRRIEDRDPQNSFRVGLIYGPSGCGKSSFVKAGLVPTLSSNIVPVLVEAAPDATETRLLNRLRRKCPYLDTELDLRESIAALRHGQIMGDGKKIVIVIDQFEQWLYSIDQPEHSELAKALRQCDGEHVQCILMVRDDFWLAFSRFMEHLEIDLVQHQNMALIDLFDPQHARRVLTEFGRAFNRLPNRTSELSRDQRAFVAQAIDELSENGKITPVRLALFAEMIKSRPWTTATLRSIGGIAGVGVMFLDEHFASENAPAQYRIHLKAVYETLGALLPQPGANLKGHMRSREELLEISGYADQPKQFQLLMRALDSELHLITRTDPEGRGDITGSQSGVYSAVQSARPSADASSDQSAEASPANPTGSSSVSSSLTENVYYQLAHDYLVPAIREWQSRMQRGTRRGRAEIRLAQRSEVWSARPESRHLPSGVEWLSIVAFTRRDQWDDSQRRMMAAANRRHLSNLILIAVICLIVGGGIYRYSAWNRAHALTDQLAVAKVGEVSNLLDELEGRKEWTIETLRELKTQSEPGTPKHLFASLALLRSDQSELESIKPALLHSDPETLSMLCTELYPHREQLIEFLWERAGDDSLARTADAKGRPVSERFNAAMALASFDPPNQNADDATRWKKHAAFFADELIYFANIDRAYFRPMVELIRPATPVLIGPLGNVMTASLFDEKELRRSAAQDLLTRLLEDNPRQLTDQMLHADVEQIRLALDLIDQNRESVRPLLDQVVRQKLTLTDPQWIRNAKRKATAAALLLRHGASSNEIWSVLKADQFSHTDEITEDQRDEWIRSELKRLLAEREFEDLEQSGSAEDFVARFNAITYGRTAIPNARTRLIQRVRAFGVNPSLFAERLLVERDTETLCSLLHALGEYSPSDLHADLRNRVLTLTQGWFMTSSKATLRANSLWFLKQWEHADWVASQLYVKQPRADSQRDWYVDTEGHTMVLLPQHEAKDRYRLEAAMAEVTLEQFKRFHPVDNEVDYRHVGSPTSAIGNITYHEAVAYCNWLSRAAGLGEDQICYPDRVDDSIEPALLYPDFRNRTGYRLPTAQEWFFMCNAGAITDYSFGSCVKPGALLKTDRISDGYCPAKPTDGKQTWTVGLERPNAFGIFDSYSNVREWTNEPDPYDSERLQLCGFDYRWHMGMTGIEPRYLGYSQPHSKSSFYGFRVFRSRPNSTPPAVAKASP